MLGMQNATHWNSGAVDPTCKTCLNSSNVSKWQNKFHVLQLPQTMPSTIRYTREFAEYCIERGYQSFNKTERVSKGLTKPRGQQLDLKMGRVWKDLPRSKRLSSGRSRKLFFIKYLHKKPCRDRSILSSTHQKAAIFCECKSIDSLHSTRSMT